MAVYERSFPISIDVGFVRIQAALLQRNVIFQDLLCGRQVVLGRAGGYEGQRNW